MTTDHVIKETQVDELNKVPLPFCTSRDDVAPLFSTDALIHGGIERVQLKDLRGRWTILFFYSSDFTFV